MTAPIFLALILAMLAIVLNSDYKWRWRNEKWESMKTINART